MSGILLLAASAANARPRIRVRGGIRVHARWWRPHRVYADYGYYRFAQPPPPPPPSSCNCGYDSSGPGYGPPPEYNTPPPVAYAPRTPNIGLGLRVSGVRYDNQGPEAAGVGGLLRWRTRYVELELDVGRERVEESGREDTRLGAGLYLPLMPGSISPYLLVGGGLNLQKLSGMDEPLRQTYLEAGGGLAWKPSPRFTVAGDLRLAGRRALDDQQDEFLRFTQSDGTERYFEGRISGIVYF